MRVECVGNCHNFCGRKSHICCESRAHACHGRFCHLFFIFLILEDRLLHGRCAILMVYAILFRSSPWALNEFLVHTPMFRRLSLAIFFSPMGLRVSGTRAQPCSFLSRRLQSHVVAVIQLPKIDEESRRFQVFYRENTCSCRCRDCLSRKPTSVWICGRTDVPRRLIRGALSQDATILCTRDAHHHNLKGQESSGDRRTPTSPNREGFDGDVGATREFLIIEQLSHSSVKSH